MSWLPDLAVPPTFGRYLSPLVGRRRGHAKDLVGFPLCFGGISALFWWEAVGRNLATLLVLRSLRTSPAFLSVVKCFFGIFFKRSRHILPPIIMASSRKTTPKTTGEASSAAAQDFPPHLKNIIEEGGFTAKQVFNMDETGLFWQKLPSWLSKEEMSAPDLKVSKDRLALLLGGNAYGDVKLKPLLVYHSENPRALEGVSKDQLPVVWRANEKAWVTEALFQDYMVNYFSPFVELYCQQENLSNKALLLLDNAPGHPPQVTEWCDNVQVVFLPPNTTLQPMDQGVIASFKAYYTRLVVRQLVAEDDAVSELTVRAFLRNYNMKKCLENIKLAWDEVTSDTMKLVWKKVWPEIEETSGDHGFEDPEDISQDIAVLGRQAAAFTHSPDPSSSAVTVLNLGDEEAEADDPAPLQDN